MNSSSTCSYQGNEIPKMPLFEKPLTPSDVGKLNRLVIPKLHAENHFPSLRNSDDDRNGSLLSFEDDDGDDDGGCEKTTTWKFRYSYWNSSQSYVLTRGWSRFVKEKGLCAGDIVVFSRHRSDARRLFIGWRSGKTTSSCDQTQNVRHCPCLRSSKVEHVHDDTGSVFEKGKMKKIENSKKLRLFGVNLECPLASDESEPSMPGGSPNSSRGQVNQDHPYHQYYTNNYSYMEINFSGSGYIYHQE